MERFAFDPAFYRVSNPDLAALEGSQLLEHYLAFGISEGRAGAPIALRENLIKQLDRETTVLEIGPFLRPVVTGSNVEYFDVLDREGLKERALAVGYPATSAPYIHYVSPTGDLAVVTKTFAAVVSSHCIEHQPDLVQHLHDVSRVLEQGGRYYLMIPDKRYCFDHFIPPSTIADVMDAHLSARRVHTARSVVEHRALTTHNDPARHWRGDHVDAGFEASVVQRTQAALMEFQQASGGYIDVHAWQFTPASFRDVVHQLVELGLSPLRLEAVAGTPFGRNEFTAILTKSAA